MKTLIAAAIVATLATPVLADKKPIKPQMTECEIKEDIALQMTIYHIDQIAMLVEQMRADILRQYPKDVDQEK